ncbi:MAG: NrpR regulatory domain-containing protein [Dissulfurispiraceae bacterium]|jgi:repressor of nif and glnA expression|nr:NrpR regulatory domain-containing protein [Dissulfurispiraceae bacterium]
MNKTALTILKILDRHSDIIGSGEISKELKIHGIDLTERTVRYHLKLLDEMGMTKVFGKEGRKITGKGRDELKNSCVPERLGFVISKIEACSYQTTIDLGTLKGKVILNISYLPEDRLDESLHLMANVFRTSYVMSDRVVIARSGERIADMVVPQGRAAIGTVCSVTINGIFLKAGIPVASRFGGVLEINKGVPRRFLSLISYEGSSLDPLEVFIRSKMTDVAGAVNYGSGMILASYREIPVICLAQVKELANRMKEKGISGVLHIGEPNRPVFEVPVGIDKVGVVIVGGLNPLALLEESGISTDSKAMSTLFEFSEMTPLQNQ